VSGVAFFSGAAHDDKEATTKDTKSTKKNETRIGRFL
jgi:hypothetical protein